MKSMSVMVFAVSFALASLATSARCAGKEETPFIPLSVADIVGLDASRSMHERISATERMGTDLSMAEAEALLFFLDRKDDVLPMNQFNQLRNEVANLLRLQKRKIGSLARSLTVMYEDPEHDSVWRGYCLQHLGAWYRREDRETERERIRQVLLRATEAQDDRFVGTAMLALMHNVGGAGIDGTLVAEKALSLVVDPKCRPGLKATALMVCGHLGEMRALQAARRMAATSERMSLKAAAVNAVGSLGDASDRELLSSLKSSGDIRLRAASRSALERLDKRRSQAARR